MSEPTYKLCPTCGEPVEVEIYDIHVINCNGSTFVAPPTEHPRFWKGSRNSGMVRESIADRAERLADRDLYPDGIERGRR